MSGSFTPGYPNVTGAQIYQGARVPVDTGNPNGTVAPQSGGMIPGTQILANAAATATPGGTKAAALQLGYGINELSVVATAADSVLLPYAYPGAVCVINNDGVASTTVFGRGTDTIDAVATATGNPMAAAKRAVFYGISGNGDGSNAGTWVSLAGAKIS